MENEDKYIDETKLDKCEHGYYIYPGQDGVWLRFKVLDNSDPENPVIEACTKCQNKILGQMLVDEGEDPESVDKFVKFQDNKDSIKKITDRLPDEE